MRKKKLATYAVALALAAAAMTGVTTQTAYAEEAVQVVATDTDAASTQETEAVVEPQTAEETTEADVEADEVAVAEEGNSYYNITTDGGTWNGNQYVLNGQTMINTFFCDGTYTYYLQADGTPMKDRLTYHPDGEHVIYFDADGHEVFSNFANVKKSIAGDPVDDMCFFDVYGYMYVNQLTFDKSGEKIYFVNEYGVIEKGKWVPVNDAKYFDQFKTVKGYAYAQEDGALMRDTFTYWNGNQVYLQGDGMLASGMTQIGEVYYLFDPTDGHIIQTYTTHPDTYTVTYPVYDKLIDIMGCTREEVDSWTRTETYNKDDLLISSVDSVIMSLDGKACTRTYEASYDDTGNLLEEKQMWNNAVHYSLTFNDHGDVIKSYSYGGGDKITQEMSYIYDTNGNKTYEKVTVSDLWNPTVSSTYEVYYNYTYNDKGEITKMIISKGDYMQTRDYSYTYYASGNRSSCKMIVEGYTGESYYKDNAAHTLISCNIGNSDYAYDKLFIY